MMGKRIGKCFLYWKVPAGSLLVRLAKQLNTGMNGPEFSVIRNLLRNYVQSRSPLFKLLRMCTGIEKLCIQHRHRVKHVHFVHKNLGNLRHNWGNYTFAIHMKGKELKSEYRMYCKEIKKPPSLDI